MASLTRESLSPLLKSTSARRRSVEICQKIGNHFLSPNSKLTLAPSSSPTTVINASPTLSAGSNCNSPFKLLSPVFNYSYNDCNSEDKNSAAASSYHYKRRASDSLWIDTLKTGTVSKQSPQKFEQFVNASSSTQCLPLPFSGLQLASVSKKIERGTSHQNQARSQEVPGTSITYNVIPPTPSKSAKHKVPPMQLDARDFNLPFDKRAREGTLFATEEEPGEPPPVEPKPIPPSATPSCKPQYEMDYHQIQLAASQYNLCIKFEELLGKGSFGTVLGGTYYGEDVAVKVLNTTNKQRKASILGEQNALSLPTHNNIVKILNILNLDSERFLIIMEKMQRGNLLNILNDPRFEINCSLAINISKQIALALTFCHRHGLLHLDVKPQNVLIDAHNCCKLSDFGNSKAIANLNMDAELSNLKPALEGTVPYTAPEIFKGANPTEKCDVYSFGITMWQILARENPYEGQNEHIIIFRVVSQGLRPREVQNLVDTNANTLSSQDKNLISNYSTVYKQAWNPDPDVRPSIIDIHKHLLKIQLL